MGENTQGGWRGFIEEERMKTRDDFDRNRLSSPVTLHSNGDEEHARSQSLIQIQQAAITGMCCCDGIPPRGAMTGNAGPAQWRKVLYITPPPAWNTKTYGGEPGSRVVKAYRGELCSPNAIRLRWGHLTSKTCRALIVSVSLVGYSSNFPLSRSPALFLLQQ